MIRRAQHLGAPWDTVAVAMTVPVLRRMLARPAHLERAEVEQEALAAVACALRTVDASASGAARDLFAGADRAMHRLARPPCRRRAAPAHSSQAPVVASSDVTGHTGPSRHGHKTLMEELGTPKVLMDERMGHTDSSVSANYSHVTPEMRARLREQLTQQWEAALSARLALCRTSAVPVLEQLLREHEAA
ncbi:hypothetical protein [Streptomyces sp. SAJ15]|uniref:hypothetical protein n=1 Tax=Streptomyces sp. SAJ15 TaxID=2011095 RepID=UPI0037D9FC7B